MAEQGSVRRALVDAGLVVAITVVAHALVSAVPNLPQLSAISPLQLLMLPVSSLREWWQLWLVYAALVGLLVVARERLTRGARLWLAVPAVGAAWLVWVLLRGGITGSGVLAFLLFGIPWLLLLVASASAAALIVSRIRVLAEPLPDGPPPVPVEPLPDHDPSPIPARPRRSALGILGGIALAIALLLAASLPMQWFSAYFALFGGEREASPEQAALYLGSFVLAVVAAVASLVLAIVERRRGGIGGSIAVLLLVLLVGFVCQVPQGSVWIEPGPPVEGPAPGEPGGGPREECAWDASRPGCGG